MNKDELKEIHGLERLTPQRQELVQLVLDNLKGGLGLWHRNWTPGSAPVSAVTGRSYRGVNNLYLSMIAMKRGYKDNRWATYNQIQENGWKFKKGSGGGTLARGKSVMIEFFEFRDRKTKEPFDISTVDNMSAMDKEAYMQENVYPLRKVYRVFNADLLEGLPEKESRFTNAGKNERVEELLSYWNKNEAKIVYGGDDAYYIKSKDEIHVPPRESFSTYPEFYTTTLHELSHSTAHSTRLDREFYGYGTEEYSIEELRAQISSLFLCQEYGVNLTERNYKNESAYIRNWVQSIKDNPEALFMAIADADKISRFVLAKEQEAVLSKEEPLTVPIYGPEAAKAPEATKMPAASKEAAKSADESNAAAKNGDSAAQAANAAPKGKAGKYMPPSEVVSDERTVARKSTDPIIALSDVAVFEHAAHTRSGQRFLALYNGRDLMRNIDKSREMLMSRLAVFTQDEEQLCRIMRTSALYDKSLPDSYYARMAQDAVKDIRRLRKEGVKSSMHQDESKMPKDGEDKTG